MLGKLRNILNRTTKLMLYKTLIMPLIDYADVIYDGANVKETQSLQRHAYHFKM